MGGMDQHREAFLEEAQELLAELESALLELEEAWEDAEQIGRVFRALHTLKGSGAMFGLEEMAAFAHEVETVFDLVRNGKLAVSRELIDLTLVARDHIRALLQAASGGQAADEAQGRKLLSALRRLLPEQPRPGPEPPAPAAPGKGPVALASEPEPEVSVSYWIRFRPSSGIFARGIDPLLLIEELGQLGDCRVVAHKEAIPPLEEIDPQACYTYWDLILTTSRGREAIRDVFIFVEDDCELKIELLDEGRIEEEGIKRLGEILIEHGDLLPEDLKRVLSSQKRIGEMLVDAGLATPEKVESALLEQQQLKELRERRQQAEAVSSVKVSSAKLDSLVDLVGELVTVQARLSQTAAEHNDAWLVSIAEEVERLTAELRDNTMSIRMLPIGTAFGKFKRLVRDLSRELGKEVAMTTEGEETELDKTVIERLNDPLVHLIRNSIDHGIEPPERRQAAGKPRQGRLELVAAHCGAQVLIQIRDDGAGLDKEAIRAKALERGLLGAEADPSDKELYGLILAPGFSTAKKLTSVSGRGVGMDVVKRAIDSLRGTIEIGSHPGQGTTISLKLPLTLAIIDGLLVQIGEGYFVLPLSAVEECVELTRRQVSQGRGWHLAPVRGELVPYIRLREAFRIAGEPPWIEQIVITQVEELRVGFVVDQVIGEHQTVIKTLGRAFKQVEDVSGATILGDGTVALILDVHKLAQQAALAEQALHA